MVTVPGNARDVSFEIESLDTADTWIPIYRGGINTFTKSTESETADTTSFGSQGQAESQKMQLGKTLTIEGRRHRDPTTGTLDPGMAEVERLAELLGNESLGRLRFAHELDTEWEVWTCHVTMGDHGGGNNDKESWSAKFTRSGPSSTEPKL